MQRNCLMQFPFLNIHWPSYKFLLALQRWYIDYSRIVQNKQNHYQLEVFSDQWWIIIIYGLKVTYSFLNVTILNRENCPEKRINLINLNETTLSHQASNEIKMIIFYSYLLPYLWSNLKYFLINHIEQIQDTE